MSGEKPQPDQTAAAALNSGDVNDPVIDPFDAPGPDRADYNLGGFVVDLEGFEGPLDLLLTLARQQKVDLMNISILALAEQYLGYIEAARRIRLEIAADYLVMAAWLAFLKSRMLLPIPEGEDELTGEELAARLQHQLRRLESMREAAETLMGRKRLGLDTFARGMPEGIRVVRDSTYECEIYELLDAYGAQVGRTNNAGFQLRPVNIHSVEEAINRLRTLLDRVPDWSSLETFLPTGFDQRKGIERRSGLASTFAASLELAKQGNLTIKQAKTFGPIFMRGLEPDGG